jgi:hypothetical protein
MSQSQAQASCAAARILRDLEQVITAMKPDQRNDLQDCITYFRNHLHQMRYAQCIENGIPIGSGVTEAACKTLVKQRLCSPAGTDTPTVQWRFDAAFAATPGTRHAPADRQLRRHWVSARARKLRTICAPSGVQRIPSRNSWTRASRNSSWLASPSFFVFRATLSALLIRRRAFAREASADRSSTTAQAVTTASRGCGHLLMFN